MRRPAKIDLPRTTQYFLRHSSPLVARIVRSLHRWMASRTIAIDQLTLRHVNCFLDSPRGRTISRATRGQYRRQLIPYLQYLATKGHLRFDPHVLCTPKPPPLPANAEAYVASLAPTHKRSTRQHYRSVLRAFHIWLDQQQLHLSRLDRHHMTRWFAHLNDRGIHPDTRRQALILVRAYLRWLDDHQRVLHPHPDELIRRTDLPKRPVYLPRPLPPPADRELQRRLAASSDILQQALLLMRRTGIRVGELASLERNCIRSDNKDRRFLKVPLGKLDNERLVPIDDDTFELVQQLQHTGCPDRPWLLVTSRGARIQDTEYNRVLRQLCHDLDIPDRVTTHRLRHTYATSLLSAGMSLVGVMRLLGHRSIHMTLRYAAITQEAVQREYSQALARIQQRYTQALSPIHPSEPDTQRMLSDIARWVVMSFNHLPPRKVQALLKRIKRLQNDIQALSPR